MLGTIIKTLNAIPIITSQYIAELRSYVIASYPNISAEDVGRVIGQLLGQLLENNLAEFSEEYRQRLKDLILQNAARCDSFEVHASDVLKAGLQIVNERPALLGELARWVGQYDFGQTNKIAVVDFILNQYSNLREPRPEPSVSSTQAYASSLSMYATRAVSPQSRLYQAVKDVAQPVSPTPATGSTPGTYTTPDAMGTGAYQTARAAAQSVFPTPVTGSTPGTYATPDVTEGTGAYQTARAAAQSVSPKPAAGSTPGTYATPDVTERTGAYQTARAAAQSVSPMPATGSTPGTYATPGALGKTGAYQTARTAAQLVGSRVQPVKVSANVEPIKPVIPPANPYLGELEASVKAVPEAKGDFYEELVSHFEGLERSVRRKAGKWSKGQHLTVALATLVVILAGGVWFFAYMTGTWDKSVIVADQNGPIGVVEDYSKKADTPPKTGTESRVLDETAKKRDYNKHSPIPNAPNTIIVGYVKEKTPNGVVDTPVRRYFERKLRINATAYDLSVASCGKEMTHPEYGITRTGTRAKRGRTIAVDPRVIPLGHKVYVAFPRKYRHLNGIYTAEDTGSMVKGYRIDVFFGEDREGENRVSKEARRFGRRKVEVYLLEN